MVSSITPVAATLVATPDYIEIDTPWFDADWVSRQRNFPLAPSARIDMFGGGA